MHVDESCYHGAYSSPQWYDQSELFAPHARMRRLVDYGLGSHLMIGSGKGELVFLKVYSTAQMQRRTLASKLIASAWIIAD